jgi:hypothetical protein
VVRLDHYAILGTTRHPSDLSDSGHLGHSRHIPRARRHGTVETMGTPDAREAIASDTNPLTWNLSGVLGQ